MESRIDCSVTVPRDELTSLEPEDAESLSPSSDPVDCVDTYEVLLRASRLCDDDEGIAGGDTICSVVSSASSMSNRTLC